MTLSGRFLESCFFVFPLFLICALFVIFSETFSLVTAVLEKWVVLALVHASAGALRSGGPSAAGAGAEAAAESGAGERGVAPDGAASRRPTKRRGRERPTAEKKRDNDGASRQREKTKRTRTKTLLLLQSVVVLLLRPCTSRAPSRLKWPPWDYRSTLLPQRASMWREMMTLWLRTFRTRENTDST